MYNWVPLLSTWNYHNIVNWLSLSLVIKLCPTLATPWTVACQAPLSMGFSRQEYWRGLPFPSPGNLPDPEIGPTVPASSPALQADSLPLGPLGKHIYVLWLSPKSFGDKCRINFKALIISLGILRLSFVEKCKYCCWMQWVKMTDYLEDYISYIWKCVYLEEFE